MYPEGGNGDVFETRARVSPVFDIASWNSYFVTTELIAVGPDARTTQKNSASCTLNLQSGHVRAFLHVLQRFSCPLPT